MSSTVRSSAPSWHDARSRYTRQSPTQATSQRERRALTATHSATVAAPAVLVRRAMLRAISRSPSRIAVLTASTPTRPRPSAVWTCVTSSRLAHDANAPEPTPSATTKSPEFPSSGLCSSSFTACRRPRDDATAVRTRAHRVAVSASRTSATPQALSAGVGGVVRVVADACLHLRAKPQPACDDGVSSHTMADSVA